MTTPRWATPISTPTRPPDEQDPALAHASAPGDLVPRSGGLSRLSLLGVAISVVAVGGVGWGALGQEPPQFPDSAGEWGALAVAIVLHEIAPRVRG